MDMEASPWSWSHLPVTVGSLLPYEWTH